LALLREFVSGNACPEQELKSDTAFTLSGATMLAVSATTGPDPMGPVGEPPHAENAAAEATRVAQRVRDTSAR
jgi:hypothetical protein